MKKTGGKAPGRVSNLKMDGVGPEDALRAFMEVDPKRVSVAKKPGNERKTDAMVADDQEEEL